MKKISTLFKKDPNNLGLVINEVNPENQWVLDGKAIPMRKYDGTACAIIGGELYKRYDAKKGKTAPEGAIPCQEADPVTGHHPHWIKCDRSNNADKYHFEAFDAMRASNDDSDLTRIMEDGTYELCGPKINGNPEKLETHELIDHLLSGSLRSTPLTFEGLKEFLSDPENDIEGIVFHHVVDDRMCKIRKSDFGVKR